MHVYHYAAYERTALGRLAQRHGTREEEVDRLLRGGVLVDLFRVVRQGLRAGVESYSIKRIEPLYALQREVELKDAGSSIVAFETWLELGPDAPVADAEAILTGIEGYNRDDVVCNWRLRDWLEERRRGPRGPRGPALARPALDDGAATKELDRPGAARSPSSSSGLTAGRPRRTPPSGRSDPEAAGRWLLAQLLAWHRREDKSAWWRFFELMGMTDEELIDEREPIGGLPAGRAVAGQERRSSTRSRSRRRTTGSARTARSSDPVTGASAGLRGRRRRAARTITISRGARPAGDPLPRRSSRNGVVPSKELAESLLRTGSGSRSTGWRVDRDDPGRGHGRGPRLLLRRPPDAGQAAGAPLRRAGETALDAATRIAPDLAGAASCRSRAAGLGQDVHRRPDDRGARRGRASGSAWSRTATRSSASCSTRWRVAALRTRTPASVRIGQKPKGGPAADPTPGHASRRQRRHRPGAARAARSTWSAPSPGPGPRGDGAARSPRWTSWSSTRRGR